MEKSEHGGDKFRQKMLETIEGYKKLTDDDKNCLHVYYGYGKGKTTSVIGLIVRTLGAGRKAAIVQFDKGFDGKNEHYSERVILRKLIDMGYPLEIYATGCERMSEDGTFRFANQKEDFEEAKRGLKIAQRMIKEGEQDLLILDEVIAAADYNLIKKADVENLILEFKKRKKFELVMTGHRIWKYIEENADLITEMRKVKHYFDKGIPARKGIEF